MTRVEEQRTVALVTLGCTRNEVDSEELAGRLTAGGWRIVEDAADADVAVVNTCGFIEAAKKDSIDALLEAADLKETGRTRAVVAVGCLAERYGQELAQALPDADAVLGFDAYADLSGELRRLLAGERPASHVPADRRRLLPISPVERGARAETVALPGHESGAATVVRTRLGQAPWAPLKIASGCDRRCAFCAIPSFRGSFVSRRPADILAEARWLGERGVREVLLVSENSTSYGKDLGDLALLEALLPDLCAVPGIERVRVSYLQPAEIRPGLLRAMAELPQVMPWYDLSFQHASGPLLRRMRRFGDAGLFLDLVGRIRDTDPAAGFRTNVIVGFPGESEADVDELERFLQAGEFDVVGVFGYSDEEGTEAQRLDAKVPEEEVAWRVERVSDLVEHLMNQRAQDRVGEEVVVLVEEFYEDDNAWVGRAAHQGPETDGVTVLHGIPGRDADLVGTLVSATVTAASGVDLEARAR
ncbi:MAG TPA: 30S ribosomal protein S12 methylthiotransferase RimO [Phycicoccus sp.]|nr:30S ribosomal protein S12 methylthiotransferase RimO [Phycicoccus sp.]